MKVDQWNISNKRSFREGQIVYDMRRERAANKTTCATTSPTWRVAQHRTPPLRLLSLIPDPLQCPINYMSYFKHITNKYITVYIKNIQKVNSNQKSITKIFN